MKDLFEQLLKLNNGTVSGDIKEKAEKAYVQIESLFRIDEVPEISEENNQQMNIETTKRMDI